MIVETLNCNTHGPVSTRLLVAKSAATDTQSMSTVKVSPPNPILEAGVDICPANVTHTADAIVDFVDENAPLNGTAVDS
jgi:hypothetical protein